MKTRPYDPKWMIQAIYSVSQEHDDLNKNPALLKLIIDTLLNCKVIKSRHSESDPQYCYYNYVDDSNPNQTGSEWQHQDCINIYVAGADLIFDLLKDGRIGGVEVIYSYESMNNT
jgi:hypothetical protein